MIRYRSFSPEAGRPKGIALLDVDGTILPSVPDEMTGRALQYIIDTNLFPVSDSSIAHLATLREACSHSQALVDRRDYYNATNCVFDHIVAGKERSIIERMGRDVVATIVEKQEFFPEVMEEIQTLQDQGRYVGLISGSPNFLIQPLAAAIGADFATGTRFFTAGGGIYHPTRPIEPRGSRKHLIAEGMLAELSRRRLRAMGRGAVMPNSHKPILTDFAPEDRFHLHCSFGDTMNDLSMLERAERKVAVGPEEALRHIATAQFHDDWDIIDPASLLTHDLS